MTGSIFAMTAGVLAGTIVGTIPAMGLTVSMILFFPLLNILDINQLLIFYISLAVMVQYTGSITSIFFGVPGETNSMPAAVEGPKFTKHGLTSMALGSCAVASINGSLMSMAITFGFLIFLLPHVAVFFSNEVKLYIFIFVIIFCAIVYNKKNLKINVLLMAIGFMLTLPGENPINTQYRFTMGIEELKFGVPFYPLLAGVLVIPLLTKSVKNVISQQTISNAQSVSVSKILCYVKRCFPSNVRGSVIGYFAGLVPGVSTVLATNLSYSVEKKLNPLSPGKQLVAAETANNSGQLSSLLPLLILGIPITGSEVILYNILTEKGWSIQNFGNFELVFATFKELTPWYVVANICGLLVAWPMAKYLAKIILYNYNTLIKVVLVSVFVINFYLGYIMDQFWLYQLSFILFTTIGLILKNFNTVPLIFLFVLGSELEMIVYRKLLFLTM